MHHILTLASIGAMALITLASVVLPLWMGIDSVEELNAYVGHMASREWTPWVIIGVFLVLGLTGFPQFLLIMAAAAVLGPWTGFLCAWVGTMSSAVMGFFLGRLFGARVLRDYGGRLANRISEAMGRHGILATAAVRNLPAGPFIFVNMVAGTSHISLTKYVVGTALGSLPKMVALSFLGRSFWQLLFEGEPVHLAITGGVILAWAGVMYLIRLAIRRSRALKDVAALRLDTALAVAGEPAEGELAGAEAAGAGMPVSPLPATGASPTRPPTA